METDFAPIALFVYNRPAHTQRTLDALRACRGAGDSELFIFSDAAKHEDAVARVNEVRRIIAETNGFRSVSIVERDRNWGLAASVIDGVTELCRNFGNVIVLEDDLIVTPGFLQYMNQALERYRDERRVMQISAYMFPIDISCETDAVFLPFTTSWGWATWQRAWEKFEPDAQGYALLQRNKKLRKSFNLDGTYPYFRMLQLQQQGKVDSWAIRWNLSVFLRAGLTLFPVKSLVTNVGFDGSGTHCGNEIMHGQEDIDFAVKTFPENVDVSQSAKKKVYEYLAGRQGRWAVIKYWIYNLLRAPAC